MPDVEGECNLCVYGVCVCARAECEWPIASSMNGSDEVNKNSFNRKHKPSWNAPRRRGRLCKCCVWSQTRALTGRRRAPLLQLWCSSSSRAPQAPRDSRTHRSVTCNILKAEAVCIGVKKLLCMNDGCFSHLGPLLSCDAKQAVQHLGCCFF